MGTTYSAMDGPSRGRSRGFCYGLSMGLSCHTALESSYAEQNTV